MKAVKHLVIGTAVLALANGVVYAERPATHPNSKKYRTNSVPSTSNRSGSATLAVRALLGKDGKTDLEMITRENFDVIAGAPGQIAKAQIKASGSGGVEFTKNYNNLSSGGHLTFTYDAVPRGTGMQVQANIRGIDPRRTDVVTVATTSKLRPDLTVSSITHPQRGRVNTPIAISALVSELNGDLGATATCVLSVNGTAVDQAPGIWVDGGDSVSCAFSHTFPQSGQYALSVAVNGVTPGDYDLSNNQKASSIDIGGRLTYLQGSVYKNTYQWQETRSWYYSYWSYWYDGYYYSNYNGNDYRQASGVYDGVHAWAVKDSSSPFPISDMRATVTGDGVILFQTQFEAVTPDWTDVNGNGCAYRSATDATGRVFHLNACTQGDTSTIEYNSYGGTATYYSAGWEQNYYYYYDYYYGYSYSGYWSYNWSDSSVSGNAASVIPSAALFNIELSLDGAADSVDVFTTTTPYSSSWNYCYSYWWYYGGSCYAGTQSGEYLSGWAHKSNQ